jgi:protein strawberry notch
VRPRTGGSLPAPLSWRSLACRPSGHTPAFHLSGADRQGVGPDPCRHPPRAIARARPRARCPRAALGDGDRLCHLRRRRRLGVEDAYEALEPQIRSGDARPRRIAQGDAPMLARLGYRPPTQTPRSEESERLQQFSTPVTLGSVAAEAAAWTRPTWSSNPRPGRALGDLCRARRRAASSQRDRRDPRPAARPPLPRRAAREPAQRRADPRAPNARNPPDHRPDEPALLGFASSREALRRGCLPPCRLGPRAVWPGRPPRRDHRPPCRARGPGWRDGFVRLQEKARVVFTAAVTGQAYARHGTTMSTRLTVVDRIPAEDPRHFPPSPGIAANGAELLEYVGRLVPPRASVIDASPLPSPSSRPCRSGRKPPPRGWHSSTVPETVELAYEACDWRPAEGGSARLTAGLYQCYTLQSLRIGQAKPHPT